MKLHHCFALYLSVALSLPAVVFAQADKPLDSIPLDVRTTDQLSDVQRQEIHKYISDWVAILQDNSDPKQQGLARDKLFSDITAPGGPNPSVDYQNEYAKTINDALMPLTKNPDTRIRLLASIVAGRVAEHVSNARLEPIAIVLLNDKSDAVILWGMRTARFVLPWMLSNPVTQNSALPAAILTAVKDHPTLPLAQDAYEASDLAANAGNGPLLAAVDQTIKLIQTRVGVFERVCPVDPAADSTGTTFLSIRAWTIMQPPQRLAAMQQISDLLAVMSKRCLADGQASVTKALSGIQPVAAAIYVIGTAEQATDVVNASKAVAQAHFLPQTTPKEIDNLVSKIYPTLVSVPDFAQIKPPPAIQTASSAPASAPAGH